MQVNFHSSITDIPAADWNTLVAGDYPFIQHQFLAALEQSGSVSQQTGWTPHHVSITDNGQYQAVMPMYLKNHSYGEYVFDWAWADAYQRHGIPYYPKLLTAIPFTPANGPRLLAQPNADLGAISRHLITAVQAEADNQGCSSWHMLLPDEVLMQQLPNDLLSTDQLLPRRGCQYHWFNRDYTDFDDFLATMTSRKRKSIKRERRRAAEQGVELRVVEGSDIEPAMLEQFYHFYQLTYAKRGQRGYLSLDFFQRVVTEMPKQIMLVLAYRGSQAVAGAWFFKSQDTLYGRYWGCFEEYHSLHFEACYYQGIEYCIQHQIAKFDPGAQGEHKIQRGFEPVPTWSLHWIEHPEFRQAIARFIQQEAEGVNDYIDQASTWLPFKAG